MKKRIFYSICMALLLVTGCYKEEFGQVEKEMKNLRDTQIAPLSDQVSKISESLSTLNGLSEELQEYIIQIEAASADLQGNIEQINESIQALKASLSDLNAAEKGEMLAKLENTKAYLVAQLANMKSTSEALKEKYDSLQEQIEALEGIVADKYATMEWAEGTFVTLEQQAALSADVEAVKALISELNTTTFKIEGDIKEYVSKLLEASLEHIRLSVADQYRMVAASYESAIVETVADVKEAYTHEIKDAIEKSEKKIKDWVNKELDDYLKLAEAEAKVHAYKILIGSVPADESLQSQIDDLAARIETLKSDITKAYTEAISEAIKDCDGKLAEHLTEGIAGIRSGELKSITESVSALEDYVQTLWDDLGKLEDRIKTLEEQAAAIKSSLSVLGDFNNSLEEYISALIDELEKKDAAEAALLKSMVDELQNAVNGKDNANSLQSSIDAIKALLGTIPQNQTSIVSWVQTSTAAIEEQLKSYATISYIEGLQGEIKTITDDHTARLNTVSTRLSSRIASSKDSISIWISEALKDYMTASAFDGKLKTLDADLKALFTNENSSLRSQINSLGQDVTGAISDLRTAYQDKITSSITDYNGYVTTEVDKKLDSVLKTLLGEKKDGTGGISQQFSDIEETIDGMQADVQTLNGDIAALKGKIDSLKTFTTVEGYTSLKGIVDALMAKLNGFSGKYADLSKFNEVDLLVNGTNGYKASIDSLIQFKADLEAAEASIKNYKSLVQDFNLSGDTLKKQFDDLATELADLKTAVFGAAGGTSLRAKLEAIITAKNKLASDLETCNASLLSRMGSFTSIAFRPEPNSPDGSAEFQFDGTNYTSTLTFDVRPKALSEAIASAASIQYVSTHTRALVNLKEASATITSPAAGVVQAVVSLPSTDGESLSYGISLALFASGAGFDFASDFIPVSGDRLYLDRKVLKFEALGGTQTVRVYYPQRQSLNTPSEECSWLSLSGGTSGTTANKLNYKEYSVKVDPSKTTEERNATVTFSVGQGQQKISCTLTVIQAGRDAQEFTRFTPKDSTIVFSWNGYVLDEEGKATDKQSADVTVETNDAQTDWTVKETTEIAWAKVEQLTGNDSNKARISYVPGNKNANRNISGTDRFGQITFTSVTGVDSVYTFKQLTRTATTLKTVDPQITFSWDGKKYKKAGDEAWSDLSSSGTQTKTYYIDYNIETEDGSKDWSVEKADESPTWFSVSARPEGDNNKENRTSIRIIPQPSDGTAKESKIKFNFVVGEPVEWTIKQAERPAQTLAFDPTIESGGLKDFAGTASSENNGSKTLKVTPSDGLNDFDVSSDSTWIHWNTGSWNNGSRTMKVWVDKNGDYDTEAGRTGYIKFTTKGANPTTYEYPVHQKKGVKRTFTFEERTVSGSNNQYYHIDEDGQLHIVYSGSGNNFMYVYVNSYPDDNWKLNVSSNEDFLHVGSENRTTRWKENDKYYVAIRCSSANTGTEARSEEIVFTCDGEDYKVKVYQDARTPQTLKTTDPQITFSWDGKKYMEGDGEWKDMSFKDNFGSSNDYYYHNVTVETVDGTTDWSVAKTGDNSGWMTMNRENNSKTIELRAAENDGSARSAGLTFTLKGGSDPVTWTFNQEARPAQTFTFSPELTFQNFKAGDITTTVTPVPNLENDQWNVTDETIDNWLTVERQQDDKGFMARPRYVNNNKIKLTATKNNSPEPRTAKLIITAGGVSYEYTVTQPGRESQTFKSFNPASGTVNFSWDGYVIGSDGKSTSSTTQDITVTTSDGETDWDVAITNTSWASVAHRENQNANKARITVGKGDNNKNCNLTGEDREGFITFTSANDPSVTSTYKFVQKARPAMSFTFDPNYIEIIKDYASNKSDKRKYRTSSSGDFTSVPYNSGKYYITLTVGVEGGGTADDWTCELISGSEWATAVKNKGTIQITPTNSNNTGVKQEIVISIKDNTTKEQVATYTFYKQGRASYTFKNLADKTYAFDKTSDTFSVETSDGSKDWYVKVFAEDGVTEITDPDYWLKASTTSNSSDVTLTMSANNGNADRKAKIRFFTFDSAATITVTQTARPAQTFKSFSPNDIDGKTYSFAAQSIPITVETSDGRTDWTVSATGTGISVVKGESDNFATLKLSKNQSETDIINGSITFTSHGGSDVRTFNFTQDVNPGPITLSIGTIDTFDFVGGYNQKLTVTTTPSGNTDWTVEKKKLASEDNGWLSFEKVDGGVNVSAALNTGSARSTGLLFTSPTGEEYPVTVSQEAVGKVTLTFDETSWSNIDGNSDQTKTVSVTSSHPHFTEWGVKVNKESFTDFLTATKNSDGKSVVIKASANSTDFERNGTISFTSSYDFVEGTNEVKCNQTACLAIGTKIMMADGSLKNIEDVVEGDLVRTFDHITGEISSAEVCIAWKGEGTAAPLNLTFASGKTLSIVGTHDLLYENTRKYVRINSGNVASFVGQRFYNAESDTWDELVSYEMGAEPVEYYCLYSANHLNCIAEGMLTLPDDVDFFVNVYELDENLKTDAEQLAADIEQYGLMDVARDFPDYIEVKDLAESILGQYLFISLGKGLITEEECDQYTAFWDDQLK